jgi:acetylornithine/succinyldiaminopimelate/putrescine aminotransferase
MVDTAVIDVRGLRKSYRGAPAVRGLGGLIGIAFEEEIAADVVKKLAEAGLITIAAGTKVVRILPALNVTKSEVQEGLEILQRVLSAA